MGNRLVGFDDQNLKISTTNNQLTKLRQITDYWTLFRARIPYLMEERLGINMRYAICGYVPNNLLTSKIRHAIKEDDMEEIKTRVFTGSQKLDDPVDMYCCHTMLHDAVILNREELFEFLISQGANLNVRDQNGYTPLLKAASIGRVKMCRQLIEAGVDPRHKDPHGNTPLDKAILYDNVETIRYLKKAVEEANANNTEFVDWNEPHRFDRSGINRTFLHY